MPNPVELLRNILTEEFSSDLPPGVHPVPGWCADPQFFPGATGLLDAETWSEVQPGVAGLAEAVLSAPERGVIVLGNYQASLSSYQRIMSGEIGGLPTTWRNLGRLLSAVSPRDVFLTNAFIGFPDTGSDIDRFPTTPDYTARCQRLLTTTIALLRPRCVVAMGSSAARMLAQTVASLGLWRPWPGLAKLEQKGLRIMPGCQVAEVCFTAVAVAHPSSRISDEQRKIEAALVGAAAVVHD